MFSLVVALQEKEFSTYEIPWQFLAKMANIACVLWLFKLNDS